MKRHFLTTFAIIFLHEGKNTFIHTSLWRHLGFRINGSFNRKYVVRPFHNIVIVVTATPVTHEETVSNDGAEKVTIGRAQLEDLNAQDLQTALRQVPGVTISRYSPVGSYGGSQGGSVYVRGLGTGRPGGEIRTYTDGNMMSPAGSADTTWLNWGTRRTTLLSSSAAH